MQERRTTLKRRLRRSRPNNIFIFLKNHQAQLIIIGLGLAVLYLRRTDALLNPQFWAEDGREWLSAAYNSGFSPLTLIEPYAGYLVVCQRLIALMSGVFPLEYTPLFFNACALAIQTLPLIYLWSKRTDYVTNHLKLFITVVYLLMPFTSEIHSNVTNSQWYLASALFLLLFIKEAKSKVVRWVDRFIIGLASITGPFSILIMPIVAMEVYRTRKIQPRHIIIATGALIQLACLVFLHKTTEPESLGLSATQFFNILGGQVFGAGLFGYQSIEFFLSKPWIAPVVALIGVELMIYTFLKCNLVLKYFIAFSTAIFIAALFSPSGIQPGQTWWQTLATPQAGGRYYFLFHTAMFVSLGWLLLAQKNLPLKVISGLILVLSLTLGVPKDFTHQPYQDLKYRSYINEFNTYPDGRTTNIPVNPGGPWTVKLKK